jgi:hypothetical protein
MNIYEIVENVPTLWGNKSTSGHANPFLLEGPPGGAKSSVIEGPFARALAKHTGKLVDVITEIPANREAPDFRGLPIPVKSADGGIPVIKYPLPDILERIQRSPAYTKGIVLLFLDELLQADVPTQKVLCDLILNSRLGEHELPQNVWIVCATNRQSDGAGVNRPLSILTNRLCRYSVELPVEYWVRYGRATGAHPMGLAFAERFPNHFAASTPPRDGAFCTYRSFTKFLGYLTASNQAKGLEPHFVPDNSFIRHTADGLIGEATSLEFFAFSKVAETLPTRQELLETPDTAKIPTEWQADAQYAASNMAISLALEDPTHINPAMRYIMRLPMIELAVKAMVELNRSAAGGVIMNNPEAGAWLVKHKALVADANAAVTSY